jgi:DNA polymerase
VDELRSARPFVPASRSLATLRAAAEGCRGCDLYKRATQVVFGDGSRKARVLLIGEQPGDREDLEGKPFVGPAGAVLTKALAAARLHPSSVYVTNAVKHFSWEPRGKRRIHKKPRASEVRACRPWLDAELEAVRPDLIVCLGATASQALMGAAFRLSAHRGEILPGPDGRRVLATIHPSAVLRAPDEDGRREAFDGLVADLRVAARALREL